MCRNTPPSNLANTWTLIEESFNLGLDGSTDNVVIVSDFNPNVFEYCNPNNKQLVYSFPTNSII